MNDSRRRSPTEAHVTELARAVTALVAAAHLSRDPKDVRLAKALKQRWREAYRALPPREADGRPFDADGYPLGAWELPTLKGVSQRAAVVAAHEEVKALVPRLPALLDVPKRPASTHPAVHLLLGVVVRHRLTGDFQQGPSVEGAAYDSAEVQLLEQLRILFAMDPRRADERRKPDAWQVLTEALCACGADRDAVKAMLKQARRKN